MRVGRARVSRVCGARVCVRAELVLDVNVHVHVGYARVHACACTCMLKLGQVEHDAHGSGRAVPRETGGGDWATGRGLVATWAAVAGGAPSLLSSAPISTLAVLNRCAITVMVSFVC